MRIFSRAFLLASLVYALGVIFFVTANQQTVARAATDNTNVVISQVQVSGTGNTHQEFVELYNPTNAAIDLAGWEIGKEAQSGANLYPLVESLSGTIQPFSYFLIAPTDYSSSVSADITYTASTNSTISNNNTIILFNDAGITRVDSVGFGTASDNETFPVPTGPADNQSIIRKASATSTADTLVAGGSEEAAGNGYDTDNNADDFVLLTTAMPHNSASPAAQPVISPTEQPTATPTVEPTTTENPTPTLTETPTPTSEPTETPTITPTETITPEPTTTETPTPTVTEPPTPTEELTPTITEEPTPSVSETPTPSVTSTPTPTVTPTPPSDVLVDEQITPHLRLVCTQTYHDIVVWGRHISIPDVHFRLIKTKTTHSYYKYHAHKISH